MPLSFPSENSGKIILKWKCYQLADLNQALGESYCLYVWHNPDDGERPLYIGKAKFFGTKQSTGYVASARYNSGYEYLIELAMRGGTDLYIARLGQDSFAYAESFEQALIEMWQPLRKQRRKRTPEIQFSTIRPWSE